MKVYIINSLIKKLKIRKWEEEAPKQKRKWQ
jgi:hypothetical protein